jgi:hypothetical protein
MVPVHSQVGPAAPSAGTVYYTDSNSSTSPTSFYAYDVAADSWTTKASLPSSNSTQLTTDEIGRVYALIDDGNIYRYDPVADAWNFVQAGPPPSSGYSPIKFFETSKGEFYWGHDFTTDLWYTVGGVWNVITTPVTISCASDVDRATGLIYVREVGALGFFSFDPSTATFPQYCNVGGGTVTENGRCGVYYGGSFYSRQYAGSYHAIDVATCGDTDTGVGPTSTHSSSAGDGAGNIYSNGWLDPDIFEVYNAPANSITRLADAPVIPGNAHSTLAFALDCAPASWSNYGAGWPGTGGVPGLTAASDPHLGQSLTINIGNSRGANTNGFLVLGFSSTSLPTAFGGTLLAFPNYILVIGIPAAGASPSTTLPLDPTLCGLALYVQVIETDPGASHGYSFTPGLQLNLGS